MMLNALILLFGVIILVASLGLGVMLPVARTAAEANPRGPRNVTPAPEFQAAIEAKQVAQQQVQTESQVLAQKQIQAQQVVVAAQGQADAQVALAKGTAEADRLIAQSLSDPVLQYQLINKLSDKINVMLVPSGNGFILDLKSLVGSSTPTPTPTPAP